MLCAIVGSPIGLPCPAGPSGAGRNEPQQRVLTCQSAGLLVRAISALYLMRSLVPFTIGRRKSVGRLRVSSGLSAACRRLVGNARAQTTELVDANTHLRPTTRDRILPLAGPDSSTTFTT